MFFPFYEGTTGLLLLITVDKNILMVDIGFTLEAGRNSVYLANYSYLEDIFLLPYG